MCCLNERLLRDFQIYLLGNVALHAIVELLVPVATREVAQPRFDLGYRLRKLRRDRLSFFGNLIDKILCVFHLP